MNATFSKSFVRIAYELTKKQKKQMKAFKSSVQGKSVGITNIHATIGSMLIGNL